VKNTIVATLVVLICTLGVGAVWSILSLISGGLGSYLAIPVAFAIVLLLGAHELKPGITRALLAAVLTAVAIAYQCYLFAVGTIAGEMGYSFGESMQSLNAPFALAIVRAHTGPKEQIAYALAILVALLFGYRANRAASYAPSTRGKKP
jgi:hypothetical protein